MTIKKNNLSERKREKREEKLDNNDINIRNILETKDEPADSRIVTYLNTSPVGDGGQWDMALNLIGTLMM